MLPQQYCLRWKYHHSNLQTMFSQLLDRGCFCDVTLACEGQLIRAHRVVLCACSSYFDTVLTNYSNERDPIIIMKDVTFADVKCLIEFMYKGEINVEHAHLASLLKTADDLKIKGLAEVSWRDNDDDGPPMPVPTAEYYSPRHAAKAYYGNENGGQRHSTPSPPPAPPATIAVSSAMADANGMRNHTRSPTPQPLPLPLKVQQGRMPTLTPIPPPPHTAVDNCMPLHISPNVEHYMGVKRKRGRPPLDDTYDVFNLRTMHQYANLEHQAYLEASRQYADEQQKHLQMHQQRKQQHEQQMQQSQHRQELSERAVTPPNKRAAAAAAYHEHVQQQQMKQRILQAQREQSEAAAIAAASAAATAEADMAAAQAQDSEWISSNLEVTVTEAPHPEAAAAQAGGNTAETASPVEHKMADEQPSRGTDEQDGPARVEDEVRNTPAIPKLENDPDCMQSNEINRKSPPSDQPPAMTENKNEIAEEEGSTATVPKPVEEIETMEQQQSAPIRSSTPRSSPTALKVIPASALQSNTQPPAHVSHYNKYAPEGYLVNEHGILMAPDFVHAPTVAIPTSSGASTSQANGAADHHHQSEYADIKMEDFDAADLRLTSEEITQWQDVIKMDDYLAKGRRPQFWEEPFTRRVLDSIKNKRLEMKKAARILGVSYGTLYGRYREVYGCLKHPYSGTTMRPNQLSLPPRLEYPFRNQANPHGALPTHLEIGKIRPKDLSELWARPQI